MQTTAAQKTILLTAAARPNFMKVAPLYHALCESPGLAPVLVHCGQHYDANMSDAFFANLRLPAPDRHLGAGGGTHAEQTGRVITAFEKYLLEKTPDLVVVVGDVNSTMACALAAVKLGVPVAHLEAGLRSFDRTMPEEINRIVTDAVSDLLWTPSADADENLAREGIPPEKIHRVGNIMIDSLEMVRETVEADDSWRRLGLSPGAYALVTLHRPANVDPPEVLGRLCRTLVSISRTLPMVFPVHPRTAKNLALHGLGDELERAPGILLLPPQDYISFMNLLFFSGMAITDSGGVQEETTYLGIPCLTLRPNTERPVTVTLGTNRLCRVEGLQEAVSGIVPGRMEHHRPPELWDGLAAGRVAASIARFLGAGVSRPGTA